MEGRDEAHAAQVAQSEQEASGAAVACPNCGALLAGAYCAQCGQRRREGDDLSARHLAGEALREFTDVESGALATLRDLVLRPGYLTQEYLAGRRQRHVSPAKLYVIVSFVFFLFAWDVSLEVAGWASYFTPEGPFEPLIRRSGLTAEVFAERFNKAFGEWFAYLRFASVLPAGLLLGLLYRGKRLYGEHLVFSLHYYAFEFLITVLYALGLLLSLALTGWQPPGLASFLIYLVLTPYIFIGLRRVYGEAGPATALKTVAYLVGLYAIQVLAMVLAIIPALLPIFWWPGA